MSGFRSAKSYKSDDPEARAKQLANLKGMRGRVFSVGPEGELTDKTGPTRKERDASLFDEFSSLSIIQFAETCKINLTPAQRVSLKLIYGLELTEEEWPLYLILTGGAAFDDADGEQFAPQNPRPIETQHGVGTEAVEVAIVVGARSGKSKVIATLIALYETVCRADKWRQSLQPNEEAYAVIVATRQDQAKDIIQTNCARMIYEIPALEKLLAEPPRAYEINFKNGMKIASMPCNQTAGRGFPIYCLIMDEVAHFRIAGVNTDVGVFESLSPRLMQFEGAKKILCSTPATKQGLLWQWYSEGWEIPGRVTIQAPTHLMNPHSARTEYLKREKRYNRDHYLREFLGRFAENVSTFFDPEKLNLAFILDGDQAPRAGVRYAAAIDQSGLTGRDRFAFAIAHLETDGTVIVDVVRAWETKILNDILENVSALLLQYGIHGMSADRYAAGWVAQTFAQIGVTVEPSPTLPLLYNQLKQLAHAERLLLPDSGELREGLANTIAYYGRNNTLSIAHERNNSGHADIADAAARAIYAAAKRPAETAAFRTGRVVIDSRNLLPRFSDT